MLFYSFESQEQRRAAGGSAFIEIQYCRHPAGTPIGELVDCVTHWQNDSLYVADADAFYREYGGIFTGGVYGNRKRGTVDLWGINYYEPTRTRAILERLYEHTPDDFVPLAAWLIRAKEYNGFYVLGM